MITILCTNCQTPLTMDEAFAGGVCRCQHCGTIQTVPKSAKDGGGDGSGLPSQADGSSKTLWRQKGNSEAASGTGLDDLADIVASSGLAGSGLQSKRLRRNAPPNEPKKNKNKIRIIGAISGAAVAAIILSVYLLMSRGSTSTDDNNTPPVPGQIAPDKPLPVVTGPSFGGVKLDGVTTIVFILDRGSGTSNVFTDLKTITLKSVQSLTADRKFQILFWQVRGEIVAFPESGVTVAGDISQSEAARKLDDVTAFGSSTVGPALQKAASVKPDAIILATGKGDDLDDSFVADVNAARPPGVKIYTFALGNDHAIKPLQTIATQTGGEYRTINDAQLRQLAR